MKEQLYGKSRSDAPNLAISTTGSNGSDSSQEVPPLSPRSAKSLAKSLQLQKDIAAGVREGAAEVEFKAKQLKATLLLQRVVRGKDTQLVLRTRASSG